MQNSVIEDVKSDQPTDQDFDQLAHKPKPKHWLIFVAIAVVGLLSTVIWFSRVFNTQSSNYQKLGTDTPSLPSPQPTAFSQVEQSINWLTYKNPKYAFLKFKYPEGSTISFQEDKNNPIEGCFVLTLQYQEMVLDIKHLCGVGGMPTLSSSAYTVVAGNDYAGIGKIVKNDLNKESVSISYFSYSAGAQQLGNFLVDSANFIFKLPSALQPQYEGIADIIATSARNQEPNEQLTLAKYYGNENAVTGVNKDGTEYTIFRPDLAKNEKIGTAVINPTGEYLAISTIIDQGPDSYLSLYSFASKNLVELNGQNRFQTTGDPKVWISDYVLINADSNGYYQYDAKNLSITSITLKEYEKLMLSQ